MSKLVFRSFSLLCLVAWLAACDGAPVDSAVADLDTPPDARCRAGMNVILGTPASDVLVGTSGDDCIVAYGANDTIDGHGGNDVLIGGPGNDTITGGDGDDDVYGDAGDDTVRGDEGNDRVYGAAGVDLVLGGNGNDIVDGGDGNDRIDGESGNDTVVGDDGCDTINAASGADTVAAGPGDDVVNANAAVLSVTGSDGNDWIAGGVSASVVNGNNGTDHCAGTSCEVAPPASCTSSSSCPSGQSCSPTAHLCVVSNFCGGFAGGGACVFPDGGGAAGDGGVPCDDGNVCTADSCDGTGCHNTAVSDGIACDNTSVCDGHESCGTGACHAGTPLVVDDGNACTTDSCDPVTGVHHTAVTPDLFPDSSCNGVDDDCDGHVDEDYVATTTSCGVGVCGASGTTSCSGGHIVDSCHAGAATGTDTTCDALDDDCDGHVDESYAATTTSCGVGVCSAHGTTSCSAGHVVDSCHAGSATGADTTCDALDDDCDGHVDEAYAPATTACGVGVCSAHGTTSCSAGHVVDSCHAGSATGTDTTCDALDDDCDGHVDESYASHATSCGIGACGATGATSCIAGAVSDSCHAGAATGTDTTCDALDDDCDGHIDESYASVATHCGLGACTTSGATSCVAGSIADSCHPGAPTGTDVICDGLDDDCDGHVDESFASHPSACGVGVCTASGTASCVSGAIVDSCHAGSPTGTDTACDSLDDDCDGHVDESYVSTATSCGLGVCHATGATHCVGGSVADSCTAGHATGSDTVCDGLDDDCDGATDEAFPTTSTSCGIGACSRNGTRSCVMGSISDSCAAGTPTGTDADCDGVDADCDAATDEGYMPVATTCGVGVCLAHGTSTCTAGHESSACTPGVATGPDTTCDTVDDDCDGASDESFVVTPSSCGVGACAAVGTLACVGGAVLNSCAPGSPTGTDATCDDRDDDCDMAIDEAFSSACSGTSTVHCMSGSIVTHDCSDHDACDGVELCDAATCVPGAPPVIDDGNACTADACSASGGVTHTPLSAGTTCSDGDPCNGGETCNTTGSCAPGTAPTVDDHNPCTADACDPLRGVTHTLVPDGTSCDDGDACNGIETCDATGRCLPGPHPLSGPCTPAAPVARIFVDEEREVTRSTLGATIASFTGTAAPQLEGSGYAGVSWSPSALASGPTMVIDLAGAEPVALDHLVGTGTGGFAARHMEWSVSSTSPTAGFSTPVAFQGSNDESSYIVPLGSISARWLRVRVLDNWNGQLGEGRVQALSAWTRPRDGGGVSMLEAGATATASSSVSGQPPSQAIDADPLTVWRANPPIAGQTLTVDLLTSGWEPVDRVRLRGTQSDSGLIRDFELWVSSSGTAPSDFVRVLTGTLPAEATDYDYYFFFPETRARYVQLRSLTNRGYTGALVVPDFQTLTPHEGGISVPFQNLSIAGGTPIIAYRWEFGDGGRSDLENPTHVFPGPGSYVVRLEVQDAWGLRSTASYPYVVDAPPIADLSYTPGTPVQGNSITATDRSISGDAPVVRANWRTSGAGSFPATSTTPPGGSVGLYAQGSGLATIALTVTDARLLRASTTRTIPVTDIPPSIDVGSDQTLVWGQGWTAIPSPVVGDATFFDGASWHCHYDFGDGATADVNGCATYNVVVPHAWSTPGTYPVVVRMTDGGGAFSEDRFFVEVVRRDTSIALEPIDSAAAGGVRPVTAVLADTYDSSAPMNGRTVTLTSPTGTATGVTDTAARATTSLDLGPGGGVLVRAAFGGDTLYMPTSDTRSSVEEAGPRHRGNCGTDFWVAFTDLCPAGGATCISDQPGSLTYELMFTGEQHTTVRAEVPGLGLTANAIVADDGVGRISIPDQIHPIGVSGSGVIRSRGVHVTSAREVCLTGYDHVIFALDGFLAIPTERLGTSYVVGGWHHTSVPASHQVLHPVLALAGTVDGTSITVTPSADLEPGIDTPGAVSGRLPAGVPFTITLDRGEAIALRVATPLSPTANSALSGTLVQSSAPIAVFGNHQCALIPDGLSACNALTEQIPPIDRLGSRFFVTPFATRLGGYVMHVAAMTDGTTVTIDGTLVTTLAHGQFYELNETTQAAHEVVTSNPALVMQFARGTASDGRRGDPTELVVPPVQQYGYDALFTTLDRFDFAPLTDGTVPHSFDNWVNVVARVTDIGGLRVDGAPIAASFNAIGSSGFAYAQLSMLPGTHRVTHPSPAVVFGLTAYGWQDFDAYGMPVQMLLRPLACSPSAMTAGDGNDNECDGRVDEELANGLDDDGDGLIDEDLAFVPTASENIAPIAYDRNVGVRQGSTVSVVLAGFDANLDTLTYLRLTSPLGGLVGSAQTYTYTPPALPFSGHDTFTYRVCDAHLCSDAATVTIAVDATNHPPTITMPATVNALTDGLLHLRGIGTDIDVDPGCAITWSLVSAPPGMTIDPDTGDIFWVAAPIGSSAAVTVRATDCHGASTVFTFGVLLGAIAHQPFITSRPVLTARAGRAYSYTVTSHDADVGDHPTYQLLDAPLGMSVGLTSGIITWTPSLTAIGSLAAVEVVAIDATGWMSSPQRFSILVTGDANAPTVSVTATPPTVSPSETSVVHVTYADDEPGVVLDSVTLDGAAIALDAAGNYAFSAATPGAHEVAANVHDAGGNLASASATVRVLDVADTTPPVVELTAPDDASVLTYLHEAAGSVFDTELYRWTLSMRRADRGGYFTLAEGRTNTSGHLATIDTTQLEDGVYVVRLYAEDMNGQSASDTRTVRIDGNAKVGVVQLSFTDMVVDAIGIPLAVVRTYDSRVAGVGRQEDFGIGWSLELRHGQVAHNRPPGQGFAITSQGGPVLPCSEQFEQQAHFTEVRLSETEWYVFRPTLANVQAVSGACTADVSFEQSDGVHPGATLVAFGGNTVRATALPLARGIPTIPSDLTDVDTGEVYSPDRFQLTLRDGRSFLLSTTNGIEQMCDANHNCVFIGTTGITSTHGPSITFVRDVRGRITQVMATDGRSVGYEYGATGNLTGFIDTLSRRTGYEYRNARYPHHLTDIVDFRGVHVAAMDYQADGRVGQTCDPEGRCLHNVYDLGSRVMTTSDSLGVPTQYVYDQRGNVTRMRDGLGHDTTYTYDTIHCPDHLVDETDPLGNTTHTTWDLASCDRTAMTRPHTPSEDPETYTTRYTHDTAGHMLTERLESGGTIHHTYDARGNEQQVLDDSGHVVVERGWDTNGTLLGEATRFGVTTYGWGSASHPVSMLDGTGRVHNMRYDQQGHLTSILGNSDGTGSPIITQQFQYDPAGRMIFADYGRGVTVTYAYQDTDGQWTRITGPTFGTVSRTFSAAGRLIGWTTPNGDTHSRVYDAAGRLSTETDELGHVTEHHYDDAGRLESTTDVARGATTTYVRDDAGRVLSTIDPLHHTTSRTYDLRGAMTSMTDASSHTWTYATTPTSSTSTTPLGETTTSTSTSYGLPLGTTFPGGATTASTQHGNTSIDESHAFPESRTDESGRTRHFDYDGVSGLIGSTDLGGHRWGYTYEPIMAGDVSFDIESGRVGLSAPEGESNSYRFSGGGPFHDSEQIVRDAAGAWQHALRTVTSPLGEVTTYHYDTEGHRDLVTLPNGGLHAMTFVAGHLDLETLPFGTTLDYTRDAAFRVTSRTGTDGSLHEMTYRGGDRVDTITDGTGTTEYEYDAAGRFAGLDYPTGGSVHYGRDALDQVTSIAVRAPLDTAARTTTYVRDDANRITEIHDPLGGVTYQTYDTNGRMSTRTLPNGIVSTWTYDARSRVDTIVHARADHSVIVSVDYDRNPSGEPFRITREDGTFVLYGYDSALRLTSERYFDATSTQVDAITYAYDDDGNRTSRTTSAGTETYHYAAGSELTDITVGATTIAHYDYDAAGRVAHRSRGVIEQQLDYDADDHLIRVADPAGANEVLWDFDAMGRRVRREDRSAGITTAATTYEIAPTLVPSLESPHAVADDAGTAEIAYVFAGEHPLLRYEPGSGAVAYYLQDSMGSTIALTDTPAASVSRVRYDCFGNEIEANGTLASPPLSAHGDFRFQGMWADMSTGLYHVRARAYDPETGRFVSRDSARLNEYLPEEAGASAFAASSPTTLRDPSGRTATNMAELNTAIAVNSVLGALGAAVSNLRPLYCHQITGTRYLETIAFAGLFGAVSTYLGATATDTGVVEGIVFNMASAVQQYLYNVVLTHQRVTPGGIASALLFSALSSGWGAIARGVGEPPPGPTGLGSLAEIIEALVYDTTFNGTAFTQGLAPWLYTIADNINQGFNTPDFCGSPSSF